MSVSVSMPQLGESVTEGTVTRWLKKEGERVEADEPLLEVSTDKVNTEIPSPVAGILRGITVAEDETVEVGAELAVIDKAGAETAAPEAGGGGNGQAEPAADAESPADAYQADAYQADAHQAGGQEPGLQPSAETPAAAGGPYPAAGGYQGGAEAAGAYQQPAAYEPAAPPSYGQPPQPAAPAGRAGPAGQCGRSRRPRPRQRR